MVSCIPHFAIIFITSDFDWSARPFIVRVFGLYSHFISRFTISLTILPAAVPLLSSFASSARSVSAIAAHFIAFRSLSPHPPFSTLVCNCATVTILVPFPLTAARIWLIHFSHSPAFVWAISAYAVIGPTTAFAICTGAFVSYPTGLEAVKFLRRSKPTFGREAV